MPICSVCGDETESLVAARAHAYEAHPEEMARRRAERLRKKEGRPAPADPIDPRAPEELELELDDERPPAVRPTVVDEEAPRGFRERIWGDRRRRRSKAGGSAEHAGAGHPKERKPNLGRRRPVNSKRLPTGRLLGQGYGLVGFGISELMGDKPVGRAMMLQASSAGDVLEALTRDTIADVPMQFIAEREAAASAAANLLGLPVLVFMYERATDEFRQLLDPLLVMALRHNMREMAKAAQKQAKEEAEWQASAAGLVETLGLPPDVDPIAALAAQIFGAAVEEEAPAPA